MNKTVSFILGLITGVVLTILTLFIIGKAMSTGQGTSDDGITMFEQPGDIIPAKKFEVLQVLLLHQKTQNMAFLHLQVLLSFSFLMDRILITMTRS